MRPHEMRQDVERLRLDVTGSPGPAELEAVEVEVEVLELVAHERIMTGFAEQRRRRLPGLRTRP